MFDAQRILDVVRPGAVAGEVVRRSGGESGTVYELVGESMIVKLYEEKWKAYKETHVYRLAREHGVTAVPTVLHTEPGLLVMTKVDGHPLSELDVDRVRFYRGIGEFLAQLHAITLDGYGYLTVRILDPKSSNTGYLAAHVEKVLRLFRDNGGDRALADAVGSFVDERIDLFGRCTQPVLCHNDLHEANVLVADGRITGFIDVENAVAADPMLDLAKTHYYAIRGDQAKWQALCEGYGPVDMDRVELYGLLHAMELWGYFGLIGRREPLASIADDIASMLRLSRPLPSATGSGRSARGSRPTPRNPR